MLEELPRSKRERLSELLKLYRLEKELLAGVSQSAGSAVLCRECAGQCCLNGKYRLNILDMVSIYDAELTVSPDFDQKPLCPYGDSEGCIMEPGLRPAGCIQFICEPLESLLSDSESVAQAKHEKTMRDCLAEGSLLLGIDTSTPLLLWAEKQHIRQ